MGTPSVHNMKAAIVVPGVVVTIALLAAPISASAEEASPVPTVESIPSSAAKTKTTVKATAVPTITVSPARATYGDAVTLSGTADTGGVPGTVEIQQRADGGGWQGVVAVASDAAGNWSAAISAAGSVELRAVTSGQPSVAAALSVKPLLTVPNRITGPTLVGARLTANVQPATYSGTASIDVTPASGEAFTTTTRVSNGQISTTLPLDFIGAADARITLPETAGWGSAKANVAVKATVRSLRRGQQGPDVKALTRHLRGLGFHTPKHRVKFTKRTGDVVLAFRKSAELPRKKTIDRRTWREVLDAKPMKAKYRRQGTYIEVDKTRQIMMLVRNGKVKGTLHVSTGATGNTPEGTYAVFQRGGSYLYRFMAFHGNFGIHGYVPVPAYPASHGCVREPMWAADWTFRKTGYGTKVIVYR